MLVENGTYGAVAREAAVYENEKRNLVVCFNFQLSDQANEICLKGFSTLAKADGTVNTKAIDNLKSVFGWDGHDPFWLVDHDLSGIPVELVVENETSEDGKTYSRVKWINKPGSGGAQMPEMADRRTVLAKYGAKFRALSGGSPMAGGQRAVVGGQGTVAGGQGAEVGGQRTPAFTDSGVAVSAKPVAGSQRSVVSGPPRPAVTPALPGLPETPKRQPMPTTARTSTMEKCWQVLCEAQPGVDRTVLENKWFEVIAALFPGKEQGDFSPEDWGKLEGELEDNVPY